MTAQIFKSTDASAPVLTGAVGSLVALLDAVLVNGYGTKAAAGWTKPFAATNKGVYRNSPTTGTGFYLDVNDAAPVTAKEARVCGYEVMTAVATGTNPFPTVAQMSTGLFLRKSATADSTARPWYILADETVFYLFVESGDYITPTRTTAFMFGDFFSYKASDAYRCMIIGRTVENSGSSNGEVLALLNTSYSGLTVSFTLGGHYIARSSSGAGGSVAAGKHGNLALTICPGGAGSINFMGQTAAGTPGQAVNAIQYPSPVDNALYMTPCFVHHNSLIRGYLKGVWAACHESPLGHLDTVGGTGLMSAKSFLNVQMLAHNGAVQQQSQALLETSNTWS